MRRTFRSARGVSAESANRLTPPNFPGVQPPDPARRASPPDPHPMVAAISRGGPADLADRKIGTSSPTAALTWKAM